MPAYINLHPQSQSSSDAHWLEGADNAFVTSPTGSKIRFDRSESASSSSSSSVDGKDAARALLQDQDVCPPEHDHRTLVLCFDGTGDQFDADVRNLTLALPRSVHVLC
jgi:hypothetical protein